MQIIVVNEKAVSEYLGFPVKTYDNLLENNKCEKFIKENELYINSIAKEDFLEFYNKTGIILQHQFTKNANLGINFFGVLHYPYCNFHFAHLVVVDNENDIKIKDNVLYLNDEKIRSIKEELDNNKNLFKKFEQFNERLEEFVSYSEYYGDFETEKNELIEYSDEYFPNYEKIKDTEKLIVTPYYDVVTLINDGTLYCNNKVYRTNVEYVFEENVINKIIVYKNKNIEYITANFGGPLSKKCDKVLYSDNCLVTLCNKRLEIIIKDGIYIANKSHLVTLEGIDDVDFKSHDKDELLLTIGKETITFDILGSYINDVNL